MLHRRWRGIKEANCHRSTTGINVTRNFRMSRGGHLLLDGNTKGYEVADHTATKVEVNPQMLSTLKNAKSI